MKSTDYYVRIVSWAVLLLALALTGLASPLHGFADEGQPLFPIKMNGKLGLIDENGSVVVEPQFSYHESIEIEIVPLPGPTLFEWREGMAIVWRNGKAGYIDSSGELIVEPQFEKAAHFFCGCAFASSPGTGIVVLNKQGRVLQSGLQEVSRGEELSAGVVCVKKRGLWGVLNTKSGTYIVEPIYEEMVPCSDYAEVRRNGRWGGIDFAGNVVLPLEYDFVQIWNSYATVRKNQRSGVWGLDARKLLIPLEFEGLSDCDGLFRFNSGDKDGYLDDQGRVIVRAEYDRLFPFVGDRAWGRKGTDYFLFDREGCILASPEFDGWTRIEIGHTTVYRDMEDENGTSNRKYGVIDNDGKIIVPFAYDFIEPYSEGCAIVKLDGKCGFINEVGTEVLAPSLELIHEFRDDLAIAGQRGCVGLMGRDGEWVCGPKYAELSHEILGIRIARIKFAVGPGSYVGYTDPEGKLLLSSQDWVSGEPFLGALARVGTESGQAYVNREGKIVWSSSKCPQDH